MRNFFGANTKAKLKPVEVDVERFEAHQDSLGQIAVIDAAADFDSDEKEWFESIDLSDEVAVAVAKKEELEGVLAVETISIRRDHFRKMIAEQVEIIKEAKTDHAGYSRILVGYRPVEFSRGTNAKSVKGYGRDYDQKGVGYFTSSKDTLPHIGGLFDYIYTSESQKSLYIGPVPTAIAEKIDVAKGHFDELTVHSNVKEYFTTASDPMPVLQADPMVVGWYKGNAYFIAAWDFEKEAEAIAEQS